MSANACHCDFADAVDHDRMLGLVDDPALLREIIGDLAAWGDNGRDTDQVGLFDMERFVGQHNWSDPVAAYWAGVNIADIVRLIRHADRVEIARLEAEA